MERTVGYRSVGSTTQRRSCLLRCWWLWSVAVVVLLVNIAWIFGEVSATDRSQPLRIGALTESWGPTPQIVGLRDGLVGLGYRENEQFYIGVRFTQGDSAALSTAARQLVQYGVDLLFAGEDSSAKAAQLATSQVPIVFASVGQPIQGGLVQSFARPGGNITGVSDLDLELGPKRLDVFREMIPSLKRILFLYDMTDGYAVAEAKVYRDAAHQLGVVLVERAVQTRQEAQATLTDLQKLKVDGILSPRHVFLNIPGFILDVASHQRIPAMFHGSFFVQQGGLASYSPDYYDSGRQAARLVDKIIKGEKPSDIPVEVNNKIEFAINLKVAKKLGLTISPVVLYQADRLIR